MDIKAFLPLHSIRAPNIMWFIGSGGSAAAGIPTAWDMIWDFKRSIYCVIHKASVKTCQDLGDPRLRTKLQNYFDSVGTFPPENSDDEYASYFEYLYPAEPDRRRYVDQLVSVGKPSYGHLALAALLKLDKIRLIWTTNFDRMIEDASIPLLGSSGKLVTVNLDNAQVAIEAVNEGRWPILVKLHGDFQSRRLKNTTEELRRQDAQLSRALIEACKRYGLAVIGYSGRDHSVMDALEEAIDGGKGFPAGLFWFYRSDAVLFDRVSQLISAASAKGIDAHLIEVATFDELMADLLLLIPDIPSDIESYLNQQPRKVSDVSVPSIDGSWPIIRLNALRVLSWPTVSRKVVCSIGGIKEVKAAIEKANAAVIAFRRKTGVMAFGSDAEVHRVFDAYNISEFDIHPIAEKRLYFDSQELGLLYEALVRAFRRECPVLVERRRHQYTLVVDPERLSDPIYSELKSALGSITGLVPDTTLHWYEALDIRLEFRLGRLWLLVEPTIWTEHTEDDLARAKGKEFVRERLAGRYNPKWNAMLDGWSKVLTNGQDHRTVRAFGIGDGMDAVFSLSCVTGFSYRRRTA